MGDSVSAGYDMGYHKSTCQVCGGWVDMRDHLTEDGAGRRLCPKNPDRKPTVEERLAALEARLDAEEGEDG